MVGRWWADGGEVVGRWWGDGGQMVARWWGDGGEMVARWWGDGGLMVARWWGDGGEMVQLALHLDVRPLLCAREYGARRVGVRVVDGGAGGHARLAANGDEVVRRGQRECMARDGEGAARVAGGRRGGEQLRRWWVDGG